jgi:hypothetical protein
MNKKFISELILLPVPIATFAFCLFMTLFINNSYSIDPDYAYLFNGLNFARGEIHSIAYVDHPGTPLQALIGLLILIIGILRGDERLTVDVLSNSQFYIKTILICIAFLISMVLYYIGKRYYKYQNNTSNSLLLQFSFLLFAQVSITPYKLFTETIIPLGSLLLILITIEKIWGKMKDLNFSILSGFILGIFIAVKISFLPVAVIPIIIATKWRNKILVLLAAGVTFFLSVLPVIDRITIFKSYILKIATHEGVYGSGQEEAFNLFGTFKNLWGTLQIEYTFMLVFALSLLFLSIAFIKNKLQFLRNNDTRILFAIFLCFILQLLIASKYIIFRYMIPSLLFSSLALTIIVNRLKSYKNAIYSIIILLFITAGYYNFKMLWKAIKLNQQQNITYSFVEKTIAPNDAIMVISKEPWMGSPFKAHSLMFGKLYCFKEGEQYNDVLMNIYPNQYFWNHNKQQFVNWQIAVMPDLIFTEHKSVYLYIQTDNPQLYPKAINDFTQKLKCCKQDSVDLKLVYSNPELDEEIYLIQVKSPVPILPKLTVISGFELRSESDDNQLLSTYDSIKFDEGQRLNEYNAFEGKYSICINADNPFGISSSIPHIQQNDFIHISIMCKRSSKYRECCIGIKSFYPKEGFANLGGVSTEIINDWEKIEYSYLFNQQPASEKVVMFIWNNSNEPMYFDDLKIELY